MESRRCGQHCLGSCPRRVGGSGQGVSMVFHGGGAGAKALRPEVKKLAQGPASVSSQASVGLVLTLPGEGLGSGHMG